jgi:hypothetical protein
LDGEKKTAALAAVKAKIESGGLKRSGRSGPRKAAPAVPMPPRDESEGSIPLIRGADGRLGIKTKGAAPIPADIPVTIRLMVEISVRVVSVAG